MSAIGKGDFVEAVRDDDPIIGGAVYVVADAFRPDGCGTCGECGNDTDIVLIEGADLGYGVGWCPCNFKPIYRPKPDAFADLLKAPTDAPLKEPVAA